MTASELRPNEMIGDVILLTDYVVCKSAENQRSAFAIASAAILAVKARVVARKTDNDATNCHLLIALLSPSQFLLPLPSSHRATLTEYRAPLLTLYL